MNKEEIKKILIQHLHDSNNAVGLCYSELQNILDKKSDNGESNIDLKTHVNAIKSLLRRINNCQDAIWHDLVGRT